MDKTSDAHSPLASEDLEPGDGTLRVSWREQPPAHLLVQVGEWLDARAPDQALAYYEAALQIDPRSGLAAWRYAQLALRRGDYRGAAVRLEAAIAVDPNHAPTLHL